MGKKHTIESLTNETLGRWKFIPPEMARRMAEENVDEINRFSRFTRDIHYKFKRDPVQNKLGNSYGNMNESYEVFLERDSFYQLVSNAYNSDEVVKGGFNFSNKKPFFDGGERGFTFDREISLYLKDNLSIKYFEKDLKVDGDSKGIKDSLRYVLGDDAQIDIDEENNSFEVSHSNKDLGQLTLGF